MNKIYVKVWK